MRPTRRLMAAGVVAVLAGTLAPALHQSAGAQQAAPETYRFLRAQVFTAPGLGTIAVGMPTERTVKVQRLDPATGEWSRPRVLFEKDGVTCGEIDGRTSPGGIALTIECDKPYYEDQAPTHSRAMVTRDLETWSSKRLPGESYRPPGISPTGSYAVWLASSQDVMTWSPEDGFAIPLRPIGHDFDTGDLAAVVTDDGTVTVAGPDYAGGRCVIGLYSRTLAGQASHQQVDIAPGASIGCTELAAYGESSTRISSGPYVDRAGRWVIGRADESSPWTLVERAPSTAPGLVGYRGSSRRVMSAVYSNVPGQPLLALGSPDRRRITVQAYDDAAQSWGPTRVVYDHGFPGCTWGNGVGARTYGVHSLLMHCYPKRRPGGDYPPYDDDYVVAPARSTRALLSGDGRAWRSIRMGGHPITSSLDRTLVAAGHDQHTTIVSSNGFTEVPAGAPGRCEAVIPIGPERLLRLHAVPGSRGYPRQLQRLTSTGWKTVQRIPSLGTSRCRRVVVSDFGVTGTFAFVASGRAKGLRITRSEHGWRAVVARGY
jgi:hypothetical protein